MLVLGVDPGTASTGVGLVRLRKKKMIWVYHAVIKTFPKTPMEVRLLGLRKQFRRLVREYNPDSIVVERLFFNTNVKTAMTVGQARGVVLLVAAETKKPLFEYTSLEAKKLVAGHGRAKKKEVQERVKIVLQMKEKPRPDDAADGLAMAICHLIKSEAVPEIT